MTVAINDTKEKMTKAIEALERELQSIRTGRANPGILDRINANFYGSSTPLKNMANISVSEGRTLVIQPFDKSTLKDIEKAILTSDLGLTPQNDGKVVRIAENMGTTNGIDLSPDGKTLAGWKSTEFGGEGEVSVVDGAIVLEMGNNMTGITWTDAANSVVAGVSDVGGTDVVLVGLSSETIATDDADFNNDGIVNDHSNREDHSK